MRQQSLKYLGNSCTQAREEGQFYLWS